MKKMPRSCVMQCELRASYLADEGKGLPPDPLGTVAEPDGEFVDEVQAQIIGPTCIQLLEDLYNLRTQEEVVEVFEHANADLVQVFEEPVEDGHQIGGCQLVSQDHCQLMDGERQSTPHLPLRCQFCRPKVSATPGRLKAQCLAISVSTVWARAGSVMERGSVCVSSSPCSWTGLDSGSAAGASVIGSSSVGHSSLSDWTSTHLVSTDGLSVFSSGCSSCSGSVRSSSSGSSSWAAFRAADRTWTWAGALFVVVGLALLFVNVRVKPPRIPPGTEWLSW
ncbi:hypothetical protein F7725_017341 [Dissostichus mawsoni]|uniref:Uncharacterized protein n=1 Tax=Dissostichus mawsoni TaxID=36200 RepID=A0A7J5Z8G8_DISMA|nr:hypothetical protein F7725_017341 [Dissostichus mawsoni]